MYPIPVRCHTRLFIISPYEIHYLRFLMEAYEGIAVVSTVDPKLGLVQLSIAPGCEEYVDRILEHEAKRLQLRAVSSDVEDPPPKPEAESVHPSSHTMK